MRRPPRTCRVTTCYEIITPESAADGDVAEAGVLYESRVMELRDLVELMKEYAAEYSCWPVEPDRNTWVIGHTDTDYEDMSEERETYHCHRDATPQEVRIWEWAIRLATN